MLKAAGNVGRICHELVNCRYDKSFKKLIPIRYNVPQISNTRTLYSKASLGLDVFEEQRKKTKLQLANLEENFKGRMKNYLSDGQNMIFTEDLKNMIHLVSSEEDTDLVISMMKRFNQQNKQLRFGSFKFGPVLMRLFYILNKPDLAIQCFQSEEFNGIFDQLITYQIFLDLLFENKMYKEILENFDIIQEKQMQGALFPRNSIVLVLGACYKLNNKESLDYAFKLWKKLDQTGYYPTRRGVTFLAALALNQNNAEAALEILSTTKNQNYTTVRNLKVLALASLNRLEDTIPILKGVLERDAASEVHTFNRDVLEKLKERILESDNTEVSVQFNRIEQLFQKQGHISEQKLDEMLCTEISQFRFSNPIGESTKWRSQDIRQFENRRPQLMNRKRPGLNELV